jgi:SpoVK/Ycf46/Vps4 family AAA+-type ATPase
MNNLLKETLAKAAVRLSNRRSISQIVESVNKPRSLTEAAKKEEPLATTFVQYIKNGNTLSPAGNVILQDKLDNYPYEIVMTMAGPVFERVKPNMDDVMVFEDSAMNQVVQEIDRFWNAKESYDKLGLMHNRGILLEGPPGCGKSICLQQVVEMMAARGDIVFFVKDANAIGEGMKAFREIEPTRKCVISFEEADEMFRYNERQMLRLMDGDAKINGVLFLGTTNYLDRMPPRAKRPGRFDAIIHVGPPTYEQRLQYLTKKLAVMEETPETVAMLAKKSDGFGFGHMRELIAGVYAIGQPVDEVLKRLRSHSGGDRGGASEQSSSGPHTLSKYMDD